MNRFAIGGIFLLLALVACGKTAMPTLDAQSVLDAFGSANLGVTNVATPAGDDTVPESYTEHLTFTIPDVGSVGGQVFVCETRQKCEAIYAHFTTLAEPYIYRGADGRVIVQLDRGLNPVVAAKFQAVVDNLDKRPADD
jgi:hypothetical protein